MAGLFDVQVEGSKINSDAHLYSSLRCCGAAGHTCQCIVCHCRRFSHEDAADTSTIYYAKVPHQG